MLWFAVFVIAQDTLIDSLTINGRDGFTYQAKTLHYGIAPIGFYPYSLRQNFLNFQVDGELSNGMKIEGDFSESDNPNTQKRGLVKATAETYGFAVGDITLPENFLQKSVIGVSGYRRQGNFTGTGFYAAPKGEIKFQEFNGNLTQGPFYLSHTPVVYNSEIVWVRRGEFREQQTKGNDYEIDYRGGTITFFKKVIEKEEIVEVIYETSRIDFTKPFYGGRFGAEYKGLETGVSQQVYDSLRITGFDFGADYKGVRLKGDYKKMGGADAKRVAGEFSRGVYWLNGKYENNDVAFAGLEKKIFQQKSGEMNTGAKLWLLDICGGGAIRQRDQRNYRYYFNAQLTKNNKKVAYLYEHSKTHEFGVENGHTIEAGYGILNLLYGRRINAQYKSDRIGMGIKRFEFKRVNVGGKYEQEWHNKEWYKTNYELLSGLNLKKLRTDFSYYKYLTTEDGSDILSALTTLKPIEQLRIDGQYKIETKNTFSREKIISHNSRAGIQLSPIKIVTISSSINTRKNYIDPVKQLDYIQRNYGFEFRKERFDFFAILRNSRIQAFNIRNLNEKTADERSQTIELSAELRITEKISIGPRFKREENIGLGFFIPCVDSIDTMSVRRMEIKTDRMVDLKMALREKTEFFSSFFYNSYYNFLGDTSLYNYRTLGFDTKLSEAINELLTLFALFGFSRRNGADPFLSKTDSNLTFYTLSPGLGAKLNIKNLAIIEGEYRINHSFGETRMRFDELKFSIKGNTKNLTGGADIIYRQGHNPDYGISEVNCNLILNL